MITVCADPGVNGGIVVAHGKEVVAVQEMPESLADLSSWLKSYLEPGASRMFIELVSGYIGTAHPGSRMFTFGENFGWLRGWAAGVGIPCTSVTPFSWQQRLGLGLRSECPDSPSWKRKLRDEAKRRFPEWKPTLKTADALLLWDWTRVHHPAPTAAKG